jgi:predicted MFS family arabinose efflux permease
MLCVATGLFGLFFFLTLFIQTVLGYSAIRAGIAYLPFAVGVVIASGLASQLVARAPRGSHRRLLRPRRHHHHRP